MKSSCQCEGADDVQIPLGVYKFKETANTRIGRLLSLPEYKYCTFFIEEVTYFD